METLIGQLVAGLVPTSWAKLAWPSQRNLSTWLNNLEKRLDQLNGWVENPDQIPKVVWISGLINPQSFLTAIMQQAAQLNSWELDKLYIQTDVTKKSIEEVDTTSKDGCYVNGFNLEGARWNVNGGVIEKAKPREMFCEMPIVFCKASFITAAPTTGVYKCPVYKTRTRGNTYVFSAMLKTKSPAERWTLAGVALLLDVVE